MKQMTRLHVSLIVFTAVLVLTITMLGETKTAVTAQEPATETAVTQTPETGTANCRYGASPIRDTTKEIPWLTTIGAGWYLTFGPDKPATLPTNGARFVPILRVNEGMIGDAFTGIWYVGGETGPAAKTFVQAKVAALPGALWLIGNEIDRITQDEITPAVYARAYHDIYGWIKETDPTAQVAISGLVEVTPSRLWYLSAVWDAYLDRYNVPMPVDVWNMHLYIINEVLHDGTIGAASIPVSFVPAAHPDIPLKRLSSLGPNADQECADPNVYCYAEHDDMSIFAEQVRDMRTWMKAHGQQNKPLILSEYSLLWPYETFPDGSCDFLKDERGNCFTPARVSTFMRNTFDYLEGLKDPNLGYALDNNRLVQQWMWFSFYVPHDQNDPYPGAASNLLEANLNALTDVGIAYRNYVTALPLNRNLFVTSVPNPVVDSNGVGTASAQLSVVFRNNGNTAVTTPFNVTFYSNAAMTNVIGTASFTPAVEGCAMVPYTFVGVQWDNLTAGTHPFWVKIDSGGAIGETNETDNVGSGVVLIDPATQVFLPSLAR